MKTNSILLIISTSIVVFLAAGFLLYTNNFFDDFESQTFNNIITPIATIFAIIIYLYTLLEIKNQSKIINNNFQFEIFNEKIEKEKLRLENWKLSLNPIDELEEFSQLISESNGLKYYKLYNSIYIKIKESDEYIFDLEKGIEINTHQNKSYVRLIYSLFTINFEIYLNNCSIEQLLKEILHSDLSEFQKKTLNELIILGLLNDYMLIFAHYHGSLKDIKKIDGISIEFSYNEIIYKTKHITSHATVDKDLGLKSSLRDVEFDRLSNFIYKNKIWK